jgi:chitin synthase
MLLPDPDPVGEHRTQSKKYLYIVPCYNESYQELSLTLNSLVHQRTISGDVRMLLIICDGIVQGADNAETTDKILLRLLNISTVCEFYEYITWDGKSNLLRVHKGIYSADITSPSESLPFVLLVKYINYGKRDSLVLARQLAFAFNSQQHQHCVQGTAAETAADSKSSPTLSSRIIDILQYIYQGPLDYMIGTDADTEFTYECSYHLINGIEKEKGIYGCVGFVDVSPRMNRWSPYIMYQYAEYTVAQCMRRLAQSEITKKVNCLSGCNQILRVCEETCGVAILQRFNYLPQASDIFSHIRSYASEDRNHVCLMLSMFPYTKTTQTLRAVAYTVVPTSVPVFLSQRRRWNLGATVNDIYLISAPGINLFERISAFVSVVTFCLSPFINVATVIFLKNIIASPTWLMLYLSIFILLPLAYSLIIPVFIIPVSFRKTLYYYLARVFLLLTNSIINTVTFVYSIVYMDDVSWGKTRTICPPSPSPTTVNAHHSDTLSLEDDDICLTLATVHEEQNEHGEQEEANSQDLEPTPSPSPSPRKLSEEYFGQFFTSVV